MVLSSATPIQVSRSNRKGQKMHSNWLTLTRLSAKWYYRIGVPKRRLMLKAMMHAPMKWDRVMNLWSCNMHRKDLAKRKRPNKANWIRKVRWMLFRRRVNWVIRRVALWCLEATSLVRWSTLVLSRPARKGKHRRRSRKRQIRMFLPFIAKEVPTMRIIWMHGPQVRGLNHQLFEMMTDSRERHHKERASRAWPHLISEACKISKLMSRGRSPYIHSQPMVLRKANKDKVNRTNTWNS